MPGIPQKGRTKARDLVKVAVTHLAFATDATAFADGQVTAAPGGGTVVVKAATVSNVDGSTFRASATIVGGTDTTGATFFSTVSMLTSASSADILTRYVRAAALGVEDLDTYTIAQDMVLSDVTP